jgi:hypothetical protein
MYDRDLLDLSAALKMTALSNFQQIHQPLVARHSPNWLVTFIRSSSSFYTQSFDRSV